VKEIIQVFVDDKQCYFLSCLIKEDKIKDEKTIN
jgi:hypothetical protein